MRVVLLDSYVEKRVQVHELLLGMVAIIREVDRNGILMIFSL